MSTRGKSTVGKQVVKRGTASKGPAKKRSKKPRAPQTVEMRQELPPKNPARHSSHRPLRPRDSMGALRPNQAEIDAALARGYAEGIEEAREQALDDLRTVVLRILEKRFGELEDRALDCIGEADASTLKRWAIAAIDVEDLDSFFGR